MENALASSNISSRSVWLQIPGTRLLDALQSSLVVKFQWHCMWHFLHPSVCPTEWRLDRLSIAGFPSLKQLVRHLSQEAWWELKPCASCRSQTVVTPALFSLTTSWPSGSNWQTQNASLEANSGCVRVCLQPKWSVSAGQGKLPSVFDNQRIRDNNHLCHKLDNYRKKDFFMSWGK